MESPPPPPLFIPSQPPPPPQKRGSLAWIWIVLAAGVVLFALLLWFSIPVYRLVQQKAEAAKMKRLEAAKPRLPLSNEEKAAVDKFAEQVVQALSDNDTAFLDSATDQEALADRVLIPLGAGMDTSQVRKGFVQGFRRNKGGLFASLMGAEVKYLHQGERDGFPTVRLRVTFPTGSVTFLEVLVRVDDKRTVRAVDLFTFVYGSFASTESRNALASMMSQEQDNPLRAALGIKDYDPAKQEAFTKMSTATRLGRSEQVMAEYDRLTPEMQNERTFFMMYLQAVSSLQGQSPEMDKRYREVLVKAPQVLGKEAAADFLRVDLQFMDNDFGGAEESLRKTEELVGRDAYLTQMRALMMLRQNKVDEAQRLEREAAKMEPDLINLVDLRMLIHAARKDYPALVNELRDFKARHQKVIGRDHLTDPEYADFLKSPEFAKWEAENR